MNDFQYKLDDCSTSLNKDNVWEDDKLRRDSAKCRLFNIISVQRRPLTICLNGEWGTGKTFFLQRFAQDYNSREHHGRAIYFNAWEDDFQADPLVAIISRLFDELKDMGQEDLLCNVQKAASPIIRGLSAVAKQLTRHYAGVDLSEVGAEVQEDVEKLIASYQSMNMSRAELKSALTALTEWVWSETHSPLLFIIDELDRCRPTFAIQVLERIKHLFSVPHLVFVIGTDICQLSKSITAVYGEINADDYLHRFFDLEVRLPDADKMDFVEMLWEKHQIDSLLESRRIPLNNKRTMESEFFKLIKYRNISLRQIEKCVRCYAFLVQSEQSISCQWSVLTAIAVVLRVSDRASYERFVGMRYNLGALIDALYPHATYEELCDDNTLYSSVVHLTRIAYYCGEQTASSKGLQKIKDMLKSGSKLEFDDAVMPSVLSTRNSNEIASYYQHVLDLRPSQECGFRSVPQVLAQMDKGLRFIGA